MKVLIDVPDPFLSFSKSKQHQSLIEGFEKQVSQAPSQGFAKSGVGSVVWEKLLDQPNDGDGTVSAQMVLKALIDFLPDRISVKNTKGQFVLGNKALGYQHTQIPENMYGHTDLDYFPEELAREIMESDQQVIQNREPLIDRLENIETPNGKQWFSTTKVPLLDKKNTTLGVLGISREVTQEKAKDHEIQTLLEELEVQKVRKIEMCELNEFLEKRIRDKGVRLNAKIKEVEEEKQFLRSLINAIPDFISAKNLEHKYVLVNRAMSEAMGEVSPEAMRGKSDFDYHEAKRASNYYADEEQIIKSELPIIAKEETPIIHNEMKWFSHTKVPWINHEGVMIGVIGVARDITERKKAEMEVSELNKTLEARVIQQTQHLNATIEELHRERRMLSGIINNLPEHVYVKDLESRFVVVNQTFAEEHLGESSPENSIGKNDFDYFPPQEAAAYVADDKKVMSSLTPIISREDPAKNDQWFLLTKVPWMDDQHNVLGVIGLARNITEQREVRQKMLELNKDLEHRVEERTLDLKEKIRDEIAARNKLQQLNKIGAKLAQAFDQHQVLEIIYQALQEESGILRGSLYLNRGDCLELFATIPHIEMKQTKLIPLNEGAIGISGGRQRSIYLPNVQKSKRYPLKENVEVSHSLLCVPLLDGEQLLGVMSITAEVSRLNEYSQERMVAEALCSFLAISLKNIQLMQETLRSARMEAELQTTAAVQHSLFPKTLPRLPNLELASYYRSASETCGDWYGVISEFENELYFLIGDVTGHGAPSALVTASACATCHTLANLWHDRDEVPSPTEILHYLNQTIAQVGAPNYLMTFFVARLDLTTGRLTYANAGHNFPVLIRNGKERRLLCKGYRLGNEPDRDYTEKTLQLQRGDLIFFFTDGLTEAENRSGEMWGERKLIRTLKSLSKEPAQSIVNNVVQKMEKFCGEQALDDDVTISCCQVTDDFPRPDLYQSANAEAKTEALAV